ncbi:MAG: preprotein translocase subunit SecG [Lentisphaerae bacterium]|nr:preprotein translocase subunit SecG [Lentisphaerota bacterium]
MGALVIVLRIIEVLVCLLLVGVILLQRNKGSGAGVSFGGGAAEAVFGAQMGDVLTKTTVILGIVFLINTIFLSILSARLSGQDDRWLLEGAAPPQAAPAAEPALPLDLPDTPVATGADALDDVPRADAPAAAGADALDDVPRADASAAAEPATTAPAAE